jgi:hypothetical protein
MYIRMNHECVQVAIKRCYPCERGQLPNISNQAILITTAVVSTTKVSVRLTSVGAGNGD